MKVRTPVRGPNLAVDRSFSERHRLLQRRRRQRFWHRWLLASAWLFGLLLAMLLSMAAIVALK
jgi:uncharacterized BrkB/YihY/UPF0761 family membrane protein